MLQDLEKINYPIHLLSVCDDLPTLDSQSAAMGAMYVLEGSTLGGKIISKVLRKQVPDLDGSLSFFDGYGDQTGEMWSRFKSALDMLELEEDQDNATHAAHETFVKFKTWIEKNESAKL